MRETYIGNRRTLLVLIAAMLLLAAPALFAATATALPDNKGFATVKEILANSCSGCHDWTDTWESITDGDRIVPGSPEKSILYQKISTDEMPQAGEKLTSDQKAFIRGWIAAGAPSTDLPISVPAASAAETAAPAPSAGFLFFPSKVVFHEVTGFTSTALFLGAGIIGTVHLLDMMRTAHGSGIFEPTGGESESSPEQTTGMISIWGSQQALRWWHVGLLVGGEVLYLGDALTGVSMFTKSQPGKLTKHDIHRYAFFTHATLMGAQIVLGFFTTDALSKGNHDTASSLAAAHAVIGLAIPLVMLGAGLENLLLPD